VSFGGVGMSSSPSPGATTVTNAQEFSVGKIEKSAFE
jgi:hypothetical protein